MRLLLDTHVFLWHATDDPNLPPLFRDAILDTTNQAFLSVVSVWELVI
ncbi:MAG: type II toxin-antitoxin system VapC family toxin [Planctomycetia bacterium]